jgi:dTDP-4-amino-4,6-dideoxygalactose transaminase
MAGWHLPQMVDGATYSHYVIRVPNRKATIREAARGGVELGELIQYSVPHMAAYRIDDADRLFPNALVASRQTINLPVHADLTAREREQVVSVLVGLSAADAPMHHPMTAR